MSEKPALLLLPNLLADSKHPELFLPASVFKAMTTIDGLIAESETQGRRFLKYFETKLPATAIPIALFNVHTPDDQIDFFLEPVVKGERWGLISDAGLPCIADPGSKIVLRARQRGLPIHAFSGPSSLMLALMLSGLPAQKFTFNGYLDKSPELRKKEIQQLVSIAQKEAVTQVLMETPFRNKHTLGSLIELLPGNFLLSVSWDLTMPTQGVITSTVEEWKKRTLPSLEKKPAVFIFAAKG